MKESYLKLWDYGEFDVRKITKDKFKYYTYVHNTQKNYKKTIIIYHGWGGSVEGYIELAEELYNEGYNLIVPEIVFHDTRHPLENHFDQLTIQDYFWRTIIQTIDEFDDFITTLEINKTDIVLVGNSMGGFISNGIFARESKLAGLVNINGSGSFVLSERLFRKRDNREGLTLEFLDVLCEYDPVERKNCSSPVLLLHGDSDGVISIEGQKDYYRHLKENEKRNDVDFQIYKNVNHQFTLEMVSDLKIWLGRLPN